MTAAEPKTQIISVHPLRFDARRKERRLQALLDLVDTPSRTIRQKEFHELHQAGVPSWAHGVRVRKAGHFQHVVEATERKGS